MSTHALSTPTSRRTVARSCATTLATAARRIPTLLVDLRARLPRSDLVAAIACDVCGQWTDPRRYNPTLRLCQPCADAFAAAYRAALFTPRRQPATVAAHHH